MGYTHYWEYPALLKTNAADWEGLLSLTRLLLRRVSADKELISPELGESTFKLINVELSRNHIVFNANKSNGYEDLLLFSPRQRTKAEKTLSRNPYDSAACLAAGKVFKFCKTDRRAYDPLVAGVLMLARLTGVISKYQNDDKTTPESLKVARQLLTATVGRHLAEKAYAAVWW